MSTNRDAAAVSQIVKDKAGHYSRIKDDLLMQTYDSAALMSAK